MAKFTTITSDGIEIYNGKSERAARKAARDNKGWLGRAVTIRRDGEWFAAYVQRAGKRGLWLN